MRRIAVIAVATLAMVAGLLAAPSVAQPPPHPHMLVIGLELDADEEPVGFRRCVDLAAGQKLPLNAHHASLHVGQAGESLGKAGHAVVPGAPVTPWANCDQLIAFFFGP